MNGHEDFKSDLLGYNDLAGIKRPIPNKVKPLYRNSNFSNKLIAEIYQEIKTKPLFPKEKSKKLLDIIPVKIKATFKKLVSNTKASRKNKRVIPRVPQKLGNGKGR